MPLDVLIFGRNGQIAFELLRQAPPELSIRALGRSELDLSRPAEIRSAIAGLAPRLIINAAAYTAVDRAEQEQDAAFAINRDAPAVIADSAKRISCALLHYSTDYVYPGDGSRPYIESEKVGPLNVYGASKLAGDEAIVSSGVDHIILRTCWVYGDRGHNFVSTILRLAKEKEELRIVSDQQGCPTDSRFIASASWTIARQVLSGEQAERSRLNGLYHLAGAGRATWFEFARRIIDEAHTDNLAIRVKRIFAISGEDYPRAARRPAFSVLDCGKLRTVLQIEPPEWTTTLHDVIRRIALTCESRR